MVRTRTRAFFLAALSLGLVSGILAQDKKVVINDNWPIKNQKGQSELSPPVVEQANQCAKSVFVTGFIPGATITVFLGGTTIIGGPFPSFFGFVDVPLTHQLVTSDKITAIQTVNSVKSSQSAIMTVSAMPSSLPSPTIDTHLFACGRIAAVHNLVSGVTVEIRDTTTNTVIGTGASPNPWGSDWDPVGTSSLIKNHLLVAKQSACTGPSADSAKIKVLGDPSPSIVPTLDTPIVGNDAITAHGLYIGSAVDFSQGGVIGSGFSTASSNWFTVAPIKASPNVTVQQALCAKGPVSGGVTPTTNIPAPTLVGPICPGSLGAVVRNTTINATLVLLKNGAVVGYGGAGPGDVELNLATPNDFAQGDTIQVVEYIGSNAVFSNKVIVGCTSTLTYHNDAQRTGWDHAENTLTPANVTPSTFGFITKTNLDDEVDTQPLVVTNQEISGQGVHTAVYVATESNTVYALDSWSGAILKTRSLGAPVPMPLGCTNNGPNVGINGTPVIDLKNRAMYVIAYTLVSGTPTYQLHALDLSTLNDKSGSPVLVKATHGAFSFNASVQRQRSALLLTNGNVYAAFASFCDFKADQSRGWVLGWNASTLAALGANELTNTLATSPSNFFLSSIWMSGYGVAADTSGNVFFVTGNSDPNANTYTGNTNIQESVVKMTPDLTKVLDLFTPNDVFPLDHGDTDYGSGGVMVIPDLTGPVPRLAVAAGKDGRNFILNRDTGKMGGFHNPDIPKHVVVDACWCGPSYFKGSDGVSRVVSSGGLTARTWKVDTSASTALSLEAAAPALASGVHDGGFFTTVSSNGTTANTALIWAVARPAGTDTHSTLVAYNGTASGGSLTKLWSGQAGTWPNANSNPNIVPTVANGRVYVASLKQIQIFGLIEKPKGKRFPGRYEEITQGPDPVMTPINIPGAAYWGTVKSVNGSQIVIALRTGKSLTVDLSDAKKTGTMVNPYPGLTVAANGTLANGVLQAKTLTRAKGPSGWGADRAK